MKVVQAPVGLGFDASTYIPPDAVAKFVAAGYRYRIGYLRRDQHVNDDPDPYWPVSLSRRELREHLGGGLLVGFVQFARFGGRSYLSRSSGLQYGHAAAVNARNLGVPQGAHLFVDAEWTDNPGQQAVLAYLRAWCEAVCDAGYRAGIYVGWEGLSGPQWYSVPHANCYWRSAMMHMRNPQPRGWGLYQGWEHSPGNADRGRPPVFGQGIDPGYACYDDLGDRAWLVSA
jgi:hypothetical protein